MLIHHFEDSVIPLILIKKNASNYELLSLDWNINLIRMVNIYSQLDHLWFLSNFTKDPLPS